MHAIAAAIPSDARALVEVGYDRGGVLAAIAALRPELELIGSEVLPHLQALVPPELTRRATWRVGDGLAAMHPGEVDGVVMAGIGARTIVAILDAAPAVVGSLAWMVLCASHFEDDIRPALARLGWHPSEESLVLDRERFYEVIVARPGPDPTEPDAIAARWGPRLIAANDPLGPAWLADLRHRFRDAFAHGLGKATLGAKLASIDRVEQRFAYSTAPSR